MSATLHRIGTEALSYLTVQQVAEIAQCNRRTIQEAIRDRSLPARRGGRSRLYIHTDDARAWANSRDGGERPSLAEEEYARLFLETPDSMAVYVLQAGENGPLKIGHVGKVRLLIARMQALQTGSAAPLYLRRLIATDRSERLEMELHARFTEWRLQGEWFAPAPAVVEFSRWIGA